MRARMNRVFGEDESDLASKKTPMRMCTGCREMFPKPALIRVVKTPEGEIKLDTTGRLNGRGAYICRNPECLKKAEKINSLAKAFQMRVEPEIYARLGEELGEIDG